MLRSLQSTAGWARTDWSCRITQLLVLALLSGAIPACSSAPKERTPRPTIAVLRQTHEVPGAARRCIVHGTVLYLTRSNSLEVVDAHTGDDLKQLELATPGRFGPATDLILHDEHLYVILDRSAVIELSIVDSRKPLVIRTLTASQLGIEPLRFGAAGGDLFISGEGGVVRHRDGKRFLTGLGKAGPVAGVGGRTVATVGRRIYDVFSGEYFGAASELMSIPQVLADPDRVAFAFNLTDGGLGGLMAPGISNDRVLLLEKASVSFADPIIRIRAFGDRLWFVTEGEVVGYRIEDDALVDPLRIPVLGTLDIDRIDDDRLVLCGLFGRAVFRFTQNEAGQSMSFERIDPAPGKLLKARTNGRLVLAGSDLGVWLYKINGEARLVDTAIDDIPEPPTQAIALDVTADITADGKAVALTTPHWSGQHVDPNGGTVHTVMAVNGEIWIGHDTGITVLRLKQETYIEKVDGKDVERSRYVISPEHFSIEGPIRYMFPLLDGSGVSYASMYGGFGVLRVEFEPI